MAELKDEHFEVIDGNKDRLYQKKKKALEQLQDLLKNYSSDTLIDMIMKESENKKNGTIKTKT